MDYDRGLVIGTALGVQVDSGGVHSDGWYSDDRSSTRNIKDSGGLPAGPGSGSASKPVCVALLRPEKPAFPTATSTAPVRGSSETAVEDAASDGSVLVDDEGGAWSNFCCSGCQRRVSLVVGQ